MAAKEPITHDLIEGRFDGAFVDVKHMKDGRVKPVIREMATTLLEFYFPFLLSERTFPYALDKEQDIVRFQIPGGHERVFLIPNSDIEGLNTDRTVWSRLSNEQQQRIQQLQDQLDTVKKEKAKIKKDLDSALEDEQEQKKGDSSGGSRRQMKCSVCKKASSARRWEQNGGACPHCDSRRKL